MLALAELGWADQQITDQTVEFRHFIRQFFASEAYQREHVVFPLEMQAYAYDEESMDLELIAKRIRREDWRFYEGPDHYRCQTNCFDIMIYDSFQKTHRESNERVLSFEGVENGINTSLYFERRDGSWYLVKIEQFDT